MPKTNVSSPSSSSQTETRLQPTIVRMWMDVEISDEIADPMPALLRAALQFTCQQDTPYGTFTPRGLKLRALLQGDEGLGFDELAAAVIEGESASWAGGCR